MVWYGAVLDHAYSLHRRRRRRRSFILGACKEERERDGEK